MFVGVGVDSMEPAEYTCNGMAAAARVPTSAKPNAASELKSKAHAHKANSDTRAIQTSGRV